MQALDFITEKAVAAAPAPASPLTKFATFRAGAEPFKMPVADVREIARVSAITFVPGLPQYVEGVLNLHGQLLPVINLGKKRGLPQSGPLDKRCILVVKGPVAGKKTRHLGVIVDAVSEIITEHPEGAVNGENHRTLLTWQDFFEAAPVSEPAQPGCDR